MTRLSATLRNLLRPDVRRHLLHWPAECRRVHAQLAREQSC